MYIGCAFVLSTLISLYNTYKLKQIGEKIGEKIEEKVEEKVEENECLLKHIINLNQKILKNNIFQDDKILTIIDNQNTIINLLKSNKSLYEITSMTTFPPIKPVTPINLEQEVVQSDEDNELLNECYDYIPLNNVKKNTGLSWLFK